MQRAVAALSRALLTAAQSTSSQWLPAATIAAQEVRALWLMVLSELLFPPCPSASSSSNRAVELH